MKRSPTSLCLAFSIAAIAMSGCSSGTVAAATNGSISDLSPASPTFNQDYQTRNPRTCAKVTHVPSAAEAAVMVQCEYEANSRLSGASPSLFLATDVVVEIGSPRAYDPYTDDHWPQIDPSARVYPLRGSSTGYTCLAVNPYNQNANCSKSSGGGMLGQGACWRTLFKEWLCDMTIGGTNQELRIKGPTAF